MDSPRYLVPFHPKRVPHFLPTCWSSAAGWPGCGRRWPSIRALSVLVVTKDSLRQSNSNYAQGGIAGVLDPEDRFEDHVADTLDGRRRPVRSGGRRDGRPRSAGADPRVDRLGHPLRPGSRRAGPGTRRRPQPRPHRPRPGRRHRQGNHAGRDRARHATCPTSRSGKTPSRSTC